MHTEADAVVVGSGINGMVAAAELAKAGWKVALLERNPQIGGFVASGERTLPGYVHDTYSSWHPLFVSGPAYAALGEDLARHGLRYCNTDAAVTASVADSGAVTIAYQDPETTAAQFSKREDAQAYLAALERFGRSASVIGALMGSEIRSFVTARSLVRLLRLNGRRGSEQWLRDLASSGRAFCAREFAGSEVDHLWAPWLLHAGLSPDHASGGFMIPILAATMHGFGLPVVAGGAGNLVNAFRGLFDELGIEVHTGTEVERIVVERGRAVAVEAGGQRLRCRRAVVASVTPTALYGSLLSDCPAELHSEAMRYRYGRGEMQVHVALSAPPRWNDPRLNDVPLVHISDGSASTAIACAEAEAGLLPRRPTVVVGQQFLLDPSRVPAGAGALWLQLQEVPFAPRDTGGWTTELAQSHAQLAIERVAAHAEIDVLAVDVISPSDLASYNVNAVAGDPYGGSSELDQSFLWRPLPSAGRHRTHVKGLWHIGASTHPGAGLGAGSGHLVASTLVRS
ncbi:NAD(P)/FAD-dependent oxidoreductase [Skermania sp. ID1734]|uniref:phytoene desaturase family protein n=1 Tax=Skermania sp. ID1734 TaxID=2597516 RepID=UPI00117FF79F|nr:NAD(P)/FAD-dependent oxidoreductase [Skermania sp. ID1734]TSD94228.1 NAD(P)/FAD-dependent oxidoreductase [Skermania sp. ID1734]